MIVVDASALTNGLVDDGASGRSARSELGRDAHWSSPDHLIVETFSAIRRLTLAERITAQRGNDAVRALAAMVVDQIPTPALLARMWQLRNDISGYDAAYVAAAELHGCPLVTADRRLAQTAARHCEVRLAT